jgi:hypothetical protein
MNAICDVRICGESRSRRREVYTYRLIDLPSVIMFPLQTGIRVKMDCVAEYVCLPEKFDKGKLTCLVYTPASAMALVRARRAMDEKPKEKEEKEVRGVNTPIIHRNVNVYCLTFILQSLMYRAKDLFSDAFGVWDVLVPRALSCTGSVAGCDFCLYFFATYNVSAHPNVCVGGCALGTVGSCTSLVGQAIQETYKLIKNDDDK